MDHLLTSVQLLVTVAVVDAFKGGVYACSVFLTGEPCAGDGVKGSEGQTEADWSEDQKPGVKFRVT